FLLNRLLAQLHQHRAQLAGIDRLLEQRALETAQARALEDVILVVVVGGHEDYRQLRHLFLDLEIEIVAVHLGHHDVGDNHVELDVAQDSKGGRRTRGAMDDAFFGAQQVGERIDDGAIVVEHQHRHPSERRLFDEMRRVIGVGLSFAVFARGKIGHPLAGQVVAGLVLALAGHLVEAAHDGLHAFDGISNRVEALVLDNFFRVGEPGLEALREQFDIVGDRFERIVDLVGEADRDFAGGCELLRMAQAPNVAGEADRTDFKAIGVVDERAGDHDRDEFAGLVAELGLEAGDSARVGGLAQRLHHPARFVDRRIDAGAVLADDLLRAVAEAGTRAFVVIVHGAVFIDGNYDVRRALDETLEIFLIERQLVDSLMNSAGPDYFAARSRNLGIDTSSLSFSNVTSTGIPHLMSCGLTPSRFDTNLHPSSSSTTTTA